MKKYIVALLTVLSLSCMLHALSVNPTLTENIGKGALLPYSVRYEFWMPAPEVVLSANKKAEEYGTFGAYWNAALLNVLNLRYDDKGRFTNVDQYTYDTVMKWSDHALVLQPIKKGKAHKNYQAELHLLRFFIKEARLRSAGEDASQNGKPTIPEVLAEFQAAEAVNPDFAYREAAKAAAELYAAAGNEERAAFLNSAVSLSVDERKARAKEEIEALSTKGRFAGVYR